VLGLAELIAGPDWIQFDFGETGVLELVRRSGEPQYDRARYQVGFAVADIESARDHLVARGVQPVTEIEGEAQAGGRWCYVRDAEGNIFEIKERPEQHAH
jgi:predicted enzyme related to lactoylglutathione lyase